MAIIVHQLTRAEKETTALTMIHKWSRTSSLPNRHDRRRSWSMDKVVSLMAMERLNVLRSVSIFAGTPDELLAAVSAVLEELRFSAGARIFSKGDLGDCLYIIAEGQV